MWLAVTATRFEILCAFPCALWVREQHWVGSLPSLEALAEEFGADDCLYYEDAPSVIRSSGARTVHSLPGMVGRVLSRLSDLSVF